MKIGKLFLCVIASAAVLAGCKEKEEDLGVPKISVSESSIEFDETGGAEFARIISLNSSRDWSVAFDPEDASKWLTVTPDNGSASADFQEITIYPDPNPGVDRTAKVIFSTSTVSTEITVTQAGEIGDANVYFNDFDKTPAEKTYGNEGKSWPYLDQSDCWQNQTGSGASSVTYGYASASARNNLPSNEGNYEGSGVNNILFGSSSYFQVSNITLDGENLNYTLSFGTIRNEYNAEDNTFNPEEFHVYISDTGEKWVELEYAFDGGFKDDTWDLASSTFTVPEGTKALYLYFTSDIASSHRIDDLSLAISVEEGTKIDFSQGVEIGPGGGDDPAPVPDDAVYYNDFDKEAATEGSTGWPYADSFDGARNDQGTGAGSVKFESYNTSVRTSGASDSHSDYAGSGTNNIFFGKDNAWFRINNITLDGSVSDYTLSFGSEKFGYDIDNTFNPDEFKVYLSDDGEKWVEIEYAFPEGFKEATWDLASFTFTVPSGTTALYIHFTASVASVYRIDDVSLVPSETAGTSIDFSAGGPIGGGEVTPSLSVDPENQNVAAEGGDYTFTVTASEGVTWQATTDVEYVTIKDLTTVTGNGTVEVSVLPNEGEARTATITIASTDANDGVSPVTVTINQAGAGPVEGMTIEQVWAAADGDNVTTGEVQVVAKTKSGFLISDETGSIYVYGSNAAGQVAIGDMISLSGERDEYKGLNQIQASEVMPAGSGQVSYPVPTEYTADNASGLSGTTDVVYITYEGELSVSDNYVNVELVGASSSTPTMSLYYLPDSFNADGMNGKMVKVTGYYIYTSGGRYLNTIVTALEESTTPYLNLSETTKNVGATAGSFSFNISSNVDWTVSSSDATNFSVDPASGSNDGTVTVTYTENTGTDVRPATITVTYGSESKTLTVNQSAPLPAGSNWTLVTSASDITTGGEYVILCDFSNVSGKSGVWALNTAEATTKGSAGATDISTIGMTESSGILEGVTDDYVWTFTASGDGFTINPKTNAALGLGSIADNNGLRVNTDSKDQVWQLTDVSDSWGWEIMTQDSGGDSRYLCGYETDNWRTYKAINSCQTKNWTIRIYKLN